MPAWAWFLIAIAVIAACVAAVWVVWSRRRSEMLRRQFGPEYERAVAERHSRRGGENELMARRRRRAHLDIRPLNPESQARHREAWRAVQSRFVDEPHEAIHDADLLVSTVMTERGYPMENFERNSEDISVDHPTVVQNYRAAHGITLADEHGGASTEDLREGMVHYRALFDELLDDGTAQERREAQ
jgi:hypothetical protein